MVERNEKCPCGSEKKFKKCCMDKPIESLKVDEDLIRKYMSEFALHTYSSQVTVAYPKMLETVDTSNCSYHIYMINKIKRLSFIKNSLKIFAGYIEIQINHGTTLVDKTETLKVPVSDDFIEYEFEGDKLLVLKNPHGGGVKLDILWLYTTFSRNRLDLEILYIGQSYGKAGDRDALKRLKSHETLQKVMSDILYEDINNEVVVTLWEFKPRLLQSIDGINPYQVTEEEDQKNTENVFSKPPLKIDNQIINVTEAALINYFKPKYNIDFVNNFPSAKHKGYKTYYTYDYNAITVELDPNCINLKIHSESKNYNQFSPIKYLLNSEEKRKSMFEISL